MIIDKSDQYIACRRLLASVITLAIKDACVGSKTNRISIFAETGLNFLFNHSDGYLTLLDIDPDRFRKRLLDYTNSTKKAGKKEQRHAFELNEFEQRNFKINYQKWKNRENYFGV